MEPLCESYYTSSILRNTATFVCLISDVLSALLKLLAICWPINRNLTNLSRTDSPLLTNVREWHLIQTIKLQRLNMLQLEENSSNFSSNSQNWVNSSICNGQLIFAALFFTSAEEYPSFFSVQRPFFAETIEAGVCDIHSIYKPISRIRRPGVVSAGRNTERSRKKLSQNASPANCRDLPVDIHATDRRQNYIVRYAPEIGL